MKNRLIAFYLPQYHPIPENDEWWGPGFTEWTNVAKAKPLFKGHDQPKIPRDLGFYDLRVPETRVKQAEMAKKAGIEGFCYWHYWFGNGRRLLNQPFDEVVESGSPDYPFCLGWANHSWKNKTWTTERSDKMLIEQLYPGHKDYELHFNTMLPAFKDPRYMKVDGKLIFLIWDSKGLPNAQGFFDAWNQLARQNGLKGFYFIGFTRDSEHVADIKNLGYDSVCVDLISECDKLITLKDRIYRKWRQFIKHPIPRIFHFNDYASLCVDYFSNSSVDTIPCIMPNWDHSPRSGASGQVLVGSSPKEFFKFIKRMVEINCNSDKLLFIKSWNEWGEGNYLEPDLKEGTAYIEELSKLSTK